MKYYKKYNLLYISYTGLLEPLGQSQVLKYLEGLSSNYSFDLITFEKANDLKNEKEIDRLNTICKSKNIKWIPLRYHKRPRLLATLYDMMLILWRCKKIISSKDIDIIHSRGYIPGFAALILFKLYSIPYIFDIRGFWPEEMINSGSINRTSNVYKLIKKIEVYTFKNSAHIISLTNAAIDYLIKKYPNQINVEDISVIPTCVDLEQFQVLDAKQKQSHFNLYCVGSVKGWFMIDWVLHVFTLVRKKHESAKLHIVTRDDPSFVFSKLENHDINEKDIEIFAVPFEKISLEINKANFGIFFYKPYVSELARSPTKMGEFLACGVPCISNEGVGDVKEILVENKVGLVMEDPFQISADTLNLEINNILEIENISERCRKVAVEYYSLKKGVDMYNKVYSSVISQ